MIEPDTQPPWTSDNIPAVLTYIYPPPDVWNPQFQFQWDYQVEWPKAGRPTIRLLRFRSFQWKTPEGDAELVEDLLTDIPVTELLMMNISKHACKYLFANSSVDGAWRLTDRTFLTGSEEAARKRFNLSAFRKMAQADPDPRP